MSDLQERVSAAVSGSRVTGASVAYWDGEQLHLAAAGLRNSVTRDSLTLDTVMHVGSITKIMTTVLLLQLVDDGLVALDDPVSRHLPELRIADPAALSRITVRMLLNHTSGIDADWLPEYGPDQERIADTVDRCADLTQLFPPGDATSYNNVAFVIAGALTQKVRGASWYTLVADRLYRPLGLTHSLVDPLFVPRFRVSIGDLTDPQTGEMTQTTRPFLAPAFAPAGSTQMMTASDLVTFARALLDDGAGTGAERILSAGSAALMRQPTASFVSFPTVSTRVGLGWMIDPDGIVHHAGGGPGVASQLFAHPESGRVLAVLTNSDNGGALRPSLIAPILESWTGRRVPEAQRGPEPSDEDSYLGVYESNIQRFEVSSAASGLVARIGSKIDVFDNFDSSEDTAACFALRALTDDAFGMVHERSGARSGEVRFVRPDEAGRFGYVATGLRLLKRQPVASAADR